MTLNDESNLKIEKEKSSDAASALIAALQAEVSSLKDELKKVRSSAESANTARIQYLASMSHEIRTPVNSIIGFVDMIKKTELTPKQAELMGYVNSSCGALLALINDIIDFSRIEVGKIDIDQVEFNINTVMADVFAITGHMAEEKRLEYVLDFDRDIKNMVIGDPNRLRQVIINLATNAIKFTEKGRIEIGVRVEEETESVIKVLFSVKDTGIGIASDDLENLFSYFSQANSTIGSRYGGAGLGLVISSELIKLMNSPGILVESVKDSGSRFYFSISFKKAGLVTESSGYSTGPKKTEPPKPSADKYKILLVEDNFINTRLMNEILVSRGHFITNAEHGRYAVEYAQKEKYDVIIMDLQMPVMNGYDAAREIRRLGIKTPIIAITASAMKGDCEACISVGMNAYITKPINTDEIEPLIKKIIAETAAGIKITQPCSVKVETQQASAVFDREKFWKNVFGKEKLAREIIRIFDSDYIRFMKEIRDAITASDPKKLKQSAHRLKGSALNVCAMTLRDIFYKIELIGDGNGVDLPAGLLESIEGHYSVFREEIKKLNLS